jgi:hypothetical protein
VRHKSNAYKIACTNTITQILIVRWELTLQKFFSWVSVKSMQMKMSVQTSTTIQKMEFTSFLTKNVVGIGKKIIKQDTSIKTKETCSTMIFENSVLIMIHPNLETMHVSLQGWRKLGHRIVLIRLKNVHI